MGRCTCTMRDSLARVPGWLELAWALALHLYGPSLCLFQLCVSRYRTLEPGGSEQDRMLVASSGVQRPARD